MYTPKGSACKDPYCKASLTTTTESTRYRQTLETITTGGSSTKCHDSTSKSVYQRGKDTRLRRNTFSTPDTWRHSRNQDGTLWHVQPPPSTVTSCTRHSSAPQHLPTFPAAFYHVHRLSLDDVSKPPDERKLGLLLAMRLRWSLSVKPGEAGSLSGTATYRACMHMKMRHAWAAGRVASTSVTLMTAHLPSKYRA